MNRSNLEKQTARYWQVSSCWYHSRGKMTVSQANAHIREIKQHVGPQRKLRQLADSLGMDIVLNQAGPISGINAASVIMDEVEVE